MSCPAKCVLCASHFLVDYLITWKIDYIMLKKDIITPFCVFSLPVKRIGIFSIQNVVLLWHGHSQTALPGTEGGKIEEGSTVCIDLYTSNLFLAPAINNNTHIDIYHQTEISVQHSNNSKLHNTKSSIHNVYIHVQFLHDGGTAHYQNIFVLKKNSVQYQQTLLVKYVHNNFYSYTKCICWSMF